jgi:hypothetical protein
MAQPALSSPFPWLLISGRKLRNGELSYSAYASAIGMPAEDEKAVGLCAACRTPMGRAIASKAEVDRLTDFLRSGSPRTETPRFQAASTLTKRRKRRGSRTCSPSCRTRLYRLRKMDGEALLRWIVRQRLEREARREAEGGVPAKVTDEMVDKRRARLDESPSPEREIVRDWYAAIRKAER